MSNGAGAFGGGSLSSLGMGTATGGGGGGMDWMKLLGGGGNPLLTAGLMFGPPLLSALGGLFGGASQSQKSSRNVFNMAQGQMGQQVFNPQSIFQNLQYGLEPQFQEQAQGLSKRLGMSSPLAQAGLAKSRQSAMAQLFGNLQMQSLQAQSQRDLQLMQIMLGAAQTS